ncbi:MAG: YaiO family outer membrane beta-barrel protein [Bacteroidales bacterium]
MFRSIWISTLLLTFLIQIEAQVGTVYQDPEEGFSMMTDYSARGDYETAKDIAYLLLKDHPENHDVSLYLTRIYGWEHNFDSAYIILDRLIAQDPELPESYQTCMDLAYWQNNWDRFEECGEKAIELGADPDAIAHRLLLGRQAMEDEMAYPEAYLFASNDHFQKPYVRNWYMMTAGMIGHLGPVTLNPYVNAGFLAGRPEFSGDLQFNLDGYVRLGKNNYAMAGYGFSPDGEFNYLPGHRAIAEFWQTLPAGFGISAGIRYFYWQEHFLYPTFSVEKYINNYWLSFRNYLFFKEYGVSGSYFISIRRYFASRFDYLTLTVGYGTAPDEPVTVISDLDRLDATSGRIDISKRLGHSVRLGMGVGYGYEEFQDGEYRHRINARLGCFLRLAK